MSEENVQAFLDKGADDRKFRVKYDNCFSMEKFCNMAEEDGFKFTVEELQAVLKANGDSFDSYGNPPKKGIWV
ncbi:Nif11-like leader peptide family natural product precursor [Desulfobacter curvatus]|uniref:Nif11-like leader peptide family natural product precursor n=1 Tax=Desulfobacter curvatus TaxID=2290 RepID=UPI000368AD6C|nr:Nif11-like leader peptide family natural product precursor [Desulfobacter curvatus]